LSSPLFLYLWFMLVFIIAVYRRPAVTKLVLNHFFKLQKKYPFKIVVAGSEGKPIKGVDYIEVDNYPISQKNNAMMQRAKVHNPDAVVLMGSDDLIDENVLKFYYELIKKKEKAVVGFYDLYFYSTEHSILSHFNCGSKSYGAGRYFPKSVLNKINWTGWVGEENRGLDGNNMKVLQAKGVEHRVVELAEIDGFLVDIKHDFNISNKNIIFVGQQVNKQIMARKKMPVKAIEKLEEEFKAPKEDVKFDNSKTYIFASNGKNKYLPIGEYKVTGFEAELFTKKGFGTVK